MNAKRAYYWLDGYLRWAIRNDLSQREMEDEAWSIIYFCRLSEWTEEKLARWFGLL